MSAAKKLQFKSDPLNHLLEYASTHKNYYQDLLKEWTRTGNFSKVPLTNIEDFWSYYNISGMLSLEQQDGLVVRSGGTTGNPKFSLFSSEEWRTLTQAAGEKFSLGPISSGDRVANLFYTGGLYGSFLFATKILENCPTPIAHFPVAGITPPAEIADTIEQFHTNVLMGTPSTIVSVAETCVQLKRNLDIVTKIFFAGDFFYSHQLHLVQSAFKNAKFYPINYATSDVGLIGYHDKTCHQSEYRAIDNLIHVEIVDEKTLKPIQSANKEGLLVVTNLFRKLMPIIRYPSGDRAMWVEPKCSQNRKFMLLGRSEEAARIKEIKFYVSEIRQVLSNISVQTEWVDFQLVTERSKFEDKLIIRIASEKDPAELIRFNPTIVQGIIKSKTLTEIEAIKGLLIEVEWIKTKDLVLNIKTGKIKRVIENKG